jgi:hypothetical protein
MRAFMPVVQGIPSDRSLFPRPNAAAVVLLKKVQPGAIGLAISLRRWHMDHLIFGAEFATAKRDTFF